MATRLEREVRNQNIVKLALAGVTVPVIAAQYSLTEATIRKVLKENKDAFVDAQVQQDQIVEARRRELVDSAVYHLYKHAKKAASVVVEVMEYAEDDRVRLSAAFGLLDRVGISPKKQEVEETDQKDYVSNELAERMIEALESVAKKPSLSLDNAQFLINGNPVNLEKEERFVDHIDSIPIEVEAEVVGEEDTKSTNRVLVRSSK